MNVKNINEKLKCYKSVVEIKVHKPCKESKRRMGNGVTERNAVLYQWQAYFYPTQYHAYFWCCVRTQ